MHIEHPDSHTHGLCDDCPRCQQAIKEPTQLDAENLRRIWSGRRFTRTDVKVFDQLYRAAVLVQRLEEAWMWEDFKSDGSMSIALFDPKPREDIDLWTTVAR